MYIVPIFIPHAGCTHECTFCNQRLISGQQQFNIASVQTQLMEFIERLPLDKPKQVALYGGSFTAISMVIQEEILAYIASVSSMYNIISLRISTRPDCIDANNLELLTKYNVQVVELGVQSLDNNVLALAKRGHTAAVVAPAVQLLKKYDFQVGIQLMVGMQGQSFESIQDTTQQVLAMQPDMVRIYSMMVIQGTELARRYLRGEFQPISLEESVEQACYIWEKMTKQNIPVIRMGLQAEELLENSIIAGSYHPAFGELVIQAHYRSILVERLNDLTKQGSLTVYIEYPHNMASKIIGMNKANKVYVHEHFPALKTIWRTNNSIEDLLVHVI